MKKVLFAALLGSSMLMSHDSHALKIFGLTIKIKYDSGTKQWNADQTATHCVGKGTCSIEAEAGTTSKLAMARLDNGNVGLVVKNNDIDSEDIQNLIVGGKLYIGKTIDLSDKTQQVLRKAGIEIESVKAGSYRAINGDDGYIIFDLGVK